MSSPANIKVALTLLSVAVAFFIGIIVKFILFSE